MSARSSRCRRHLTQALKAELSTWGPGKYDPRHHAFDGTSLTILNARSLPVVIPPIYGLKHVGFETYTGDGPIWYWNSYVGVSQMGGQGNFHDRRIGMFIDQSPDLVTPKLGALLDYQQRLHTPRPPHGSFNRQAANRGRQLFHQARCASCHSGSTYTDVLSSPQQRAFSARRQRDWNGTGVCHPERNRQISDDSASRALAASALLPRRQCRQPARGCRALQHAVWVEPERSPEGGSC